MTEEKLDKLAEAYQDDNTTIRYYGPGNGSVPEYDKTMAEAFKDGWNACKRQMMSEAIEGEVDFEYFGYKVIRPDLKQFDALLESMNHGDKVRVIVVKEN